MIVEMASESLSQPFLIHCWSTWVMACMEIMSNGIFKSPVHRVVTNAAKERLSLAMFYSLEPEKELEPAAGLIDEERPRLYKTVKTKDYIAVLFETFAQGKRAIDWAKI